MGAERLHDYDPSLHKERPMWGTPDFERFMLPVDVLGRMRPRSELYRDHSEKLVVIYEPLEEIADGRWLINVNSRVYVVDEHVLVEGLEYEVDR